MDGIIAVGAGETFDSADLGGDLSACLNAFAHAAGQSLFVLKPEHARHLSTVQQVVNVLQAFTFKNLD